MKDRIKSSAQWFGKLSLLKKGIIVVVVLALIGLGVSQAFGQQNSKPEYQTAQVQKGTIISTVTASGNITSSSQAGVGSPTTGIITEIYVKNGDMVTQGQPLFKVKSTASAQEIASAWASYQSALVSQNTAGTSKLVNQATLEKDRAAVLSAAQAVTTMQNTVAASQPNPATKQSYTQNEIDAINSALTNAKETFAADEQKYNQTGQSITAANASLNSAYLSYQATQDSDVPAPIDGTVANITVQPGDQITASGGNLSSNQNSNASSSNSSSSTNAVLYIGNYSKPYIKVQASEVDVPSLHEGQKATITLDAFPGKTFVGTVDSVDSSGVISSGVVSYNVFVSFVAPLSTILPGMTASVTIQTDRKDDVLSVPTAAIQSADGQSTVRVLKNGSISSVDVTTGIISDTETEIISGLSEGDVVVTGQSANRTTSGTTTSPFNRTFGGGFGGAAGGGGGGNRVRIGN
jgi:macrolide-specific efflux system membrane fusion protein